MTRKEVEDRRIKNTEEKGQRALETARLFIQYNGNISDIELSDKLNEMGIKTSSSTVGRDLSLNLENYYRYLNNKRFEIDNHFNNGIFLTEEQKKIINFIKEKRKDNKYEGKKKGGRNSLINNEIIKDDKGHFKGSKPRNV